MSTEFPPPAPLEHLDRPDDGKGEPQGIGLSFQDQVSPRVED